ncbi:hypothetical protein [Alteromonas sp. a30]|uniref:hypothetical protein n=1 Tax=Alteromonas sp. a30 TaxID=2730917 RepID=UPI00227F8297|nr:hypothetical protein [Alteromonas sp. a30]MCY7296586.1 hypothetical protein [Alteromonas sp. a30]
MFKSTQLTCFFLFIVVGLVITLMLPTQSLPEMLMPFPRAEDKNNHIAIFTLFTLISRYCLSLSPFRLSMLMTSIAGGTELIQELSPYRTGSMLDFQANLIGIAVGMITAIVATSLIQWINKHYASGYPR